MNATLTRGRQGTPARCAARWGQPGVPPRHPPRRQPWATRRRGGPGTGPPSSPAPPRPTRAVRDDCRPLPTGRPSRRALDSRSPWRTRSTGGTALTHAPHPLKPGHVSESIRPRSAWARRGACRGLFPGLGTRRGRRRGSHSGAGGPASPRRRAGGAPRCTPGGCSGSARPRARPRAVGVGRLSATASPPQSCAAERGAPWETRRAPPREPGPAPGTLMAATDGRRAGLRTAGVGARRGRAAASSPSGRLGRSGSHDPCTAVAGMADAPSAPRVSALERGRLRRGDRGVALHHWSDVPAERHGLGSGPAQPCLPTARRQ